ncbi:hypothetical protein B0H15DRAFT_942014 [Mycena belliarum]|uniref:Uncharacterized protein n=1 Tax=Mycena belliarum TaxID=1033014 RepID=A0AAD6Y211_9AGAR|nr:hypothetical protein B0H15DRAFT_942014 [Mycena belliae]
MPESFACPPCPRLCSRARVRSFRPPSPSRSCVYMWPACCRPSANPTPPRPPVPSRLTLERANSVRIHRRCSACNPYAALSQHKLAAFPALVCTASLARAPSPAAPSKSVAPNARTAAHPDSLLNGSTRVHHGLDDPGLTRDGGQYRSTRHLLGHGPPQDHPLKLTALLTDPALPFKATPREIARWCLTAPPAHPALYHAATLRVSTHAHPLSESDAHLWPLPAPETHTSPTACGTHGGARECADVVYMPLAVLLMYALRHVPPAERARSSIAIGAARLRLCAAGVESSWGGVSMPSTCHAAVTQTRGAQSRPFEWGGVYTSSPPS